MISAVDYFRPLQIQYNIVMNNLLKESMNKTKKSTGRKESNAARGTVSVCTNVSREVNGMYRARKMVNGKRMSRNFDKMKDARAWVNSL